MKLSNTLQRSMDAPEGQGAFVPVELPYMPRIDLNEQLVPNKQDTFYLRVNTDCMSGAGIQSGDMLIVDRSVKPDNGKIIIALMDGELLVRYYEQQRGRKRLIPATPALAPIEVDAAARFAVWGVVTYVIKKCSS